MKSHFKLLAAVLSVSLLGGCVRKSSEQLSESSQTASESASSAVSSVIPEASSTPEESAPAPSTPAPTTPENREDFVGAEAAATSPSSPT